MSEFKRLTGWSKEGAYVRECFERNEDQGGCEDMDTSKCTFCKHSLEISERLAKYEDSNLSPEEAQELAKAKSEGRIIILPVPIGAPVYVPYKYKDVDGSIDSGVEMEMLSGYIKEDEREYYTTYDELYGANDHEIGSFYLTLDDAEAALETLEADPIGKELKCRVCGCTWQTPCEGGCYWVEADLCSKCAEEMEATNEGNN